MAAAARSLGRPGAADAVATLTLALADRRPLPPAEAIAAIAARADADDGGRRGTFDATRRRDRDPATDRRQDVPRRAARPVHDDAGRGTGRPVRDGPQHPRAAGLVRFARAQGIALTLLGRGSDVVIADAGIRGLVVQNRAEGSRIEGERYVAESGVPMARAATETQKAGLTGLEFGLAIPGTVGGAVWANAGRTTTTSRRSSSRRRSCSPTAPRRG